VKNQNAFIFRISKDNDNQGNPIGRCPLDYSNIKKTIANLPASQITPIDYDDNGHLDFIHKEFWINNILRQGWGIENLDLNQDIKPWIENYMLSGKKFWNADINCDAAKGRWNILSRMLDIKENDILFIPKTSSLHLDDYHRFTVCQVKSRYFFDYPSEIQDFGHCLKVKNIKEFKYGKSTLEGNDFSAPYLWAITQIRPHHGRYNKMRKFIQREFNIVI